jgi:hypothetical protein
LVFYLRLIRFPVVRLIGTLPDFLRSEVCRIERLQLCCCLFYRFLRSRYRNLPANSGEWSEVESDMPGYRFWSASNVPLFVGTGSWNWGKLNVNMRAYTSLSGSFLMQSVGKLITEDSEPKDDPNWTPKANTQSAPHAANKY